MRKARPAAGCDGPCGGSGAIASVPARARERLLGLRVPEAFHRAAALRLRGPWPPPASTREDAAARAPRGVDTEATWDYEALDGFDGTDGMEAEIDDEAVELEEGGAEEEGESRDQADDGRYDDVADDEYEEHFPVESATVPGPTFMTGWRIREVGEPSRNARLRRFMDGSLSALVTNACHRPPVLFQTRRAGPLGEPPEQLDPVVVRGHGTVRRGRKDVPLAGGGERPYIWLWFEPLAGTGCDYRWYQFVQVSFFYRGKLKFPPFNPLMEAATGRPVRFRRNTRTARWNADYHEKDRGGRPVRGPGFRPPGLGIPRNDPGKPFREYDIPGTKASAGGTTRHKGILDAPDFCGDNPPPILRCVLEVLAQSFKRQERQPADRPRPRTRSARIVIDARSYLTCIKGGKVTCLGFVPWTYTQSATVHFTWNDGGTAGGTARVYKLTARLASCTRTLAIGDWVSPC